MEIKIEKAILHILDSSSLSPVFSENEIDLDDNNATLFILNHIKKIINDLSIKNGSIKKNSIFFSFIDNLYSDFINTSIKIADKLFYIMKSNIDIPSADLLISLVNIDGNPFLALIKFNYRNGYTHYIEQGEQGINNKIIQHKVIFASENQRIDEAGLINIQNLSTMILEKKYLINGDKIDYFSKLFLEIQTQLSKKESLKIVSDVANELAHKYYNGDFKKQGDLKEAIYKDIELQGSVDIENIAETTFGDDETVKTEYIETVKKTGVNNIIEIENNISKNSFTKYKIKTDNGIELNIPMSLYRNKSAIEIINNVDGTYSILIKQINKIINK